MPNDQRTSVYHRKNQPIIIAPMSKFQLNCEQELIAAINTEYNPAMIEVGAIPDEIAEIHRQKRQAERVTDEDELLAEMSIRDHLKVIKGITVVKSCTSKFCAIYERLQPCSNLLIYDNNELTYYGDGVPALIHAYDHLITKNKAHYGGGPNKFFSIHKGTLTTEGINQIRKEIIMLIHSI